MCMYKQERSGVAVFTRWFAMEVNGILFSSGTLGIFGGIGTSHWLALFCEMIGSLTA